MRALLMTAFVSLIVQNARAQEPESVAPEQIEDASPPPAASTEIPTAPAAPEPTTAVVSNDGLRVTQDAFLWTTSALIGLHAVDHVLQGDVTCNAKVLAFNPGCTPFAGSFGVTIPAFYIATMLGTRYLFDPGPLTWTVVDSVFPHGFVHFEDPATVYDRWTTSRANLFEIDSPVLGVAGATIVHGAAFAMGGHLALSIAEGVMTGFTFGRTAPRNEQRPALAFIPLDGGALVALSGSL